MWIFTSDYHQQSSSSTPSSSSSRVEVLFTLVELIITIKPFGLGVYNIGGDNGRDGQISICLFKPLCRFHPFAVGCGHGLLLLISFFLLLFSIFLLIACALFDRGR